MTTTKFVRRSLRQVSEELAEQGHRASPASVGQLLEEEGYRLHVNRKSYSGPKHEEREAQFQSLQIWVDLFTEQGWPILSVDTKKKELIGNFANAGAVWSQVPEEVNDHDFRQDAACRAVPYGLYDVGANHGHVVVGTSGDTPAFAVEAIVSWWRRYGRARYPGAENLLILADAGGSNGCRPRLWKERLQTCLADPYGLMVTVVHYPTGASKWNPVEHRLFGPISTNWAGVPLRSLDIMLACLRGTHTDTGLRVTAEINRHHYSTGIKVSTAQMHALEMEPYEVCPRWCYTISPRQLELLN